MRILSTLLWCDYRALRRELVLLAGLVFLAIALLAFAISPEESGQGEFHVLLGTFGIAGLGSLCLVLSLLYRDHEVFGRTLRGRLPATPVQLAGARALGGGVAILCACLLGALVTLLFLVPFARVPIQDADVRRTTRLCTGALFALFGWILLFSRTERTGRSALLWAIAVCILFVAVQGFRNWSGLGIGRHVRPNTTSACYSAALDLHHSLVLALPFWVVASLASAASKRLLAIVRPCLRYLIPLGIVGYALVPALRMQLRYVIEPGNPEVTLQNCELLEDGRHLFVQGRIDHTGGAPILVDLERQEWRYWDREPTGYERFRSWARRTHQAVVGWPQRGYEELGQHGLRFERVVSVSYLLGPKAERTSTRWLETGEKVKFADLPAELEELRRLRRELGGLILARTERGYLLHLWRRRDRKASLGHWTETEGLRPLDRETRLRVLHRQLPWLDTWNVPGLGIFSFRDGRILEGSARFAGGETRLRDLGTEWLVSEGSLTATRHSTWTPGSEPTSIPVLDGVETGRTQVLASGEVLFHAGESLHRWSRRQGAQSIRLEWAEGVDARPLQLVPQRGTLPTMLEFRDAAKSDAGHRDVFLGWYDAERATIELTEALGDVSLLTQRGEELYLFSSHALYQLRSGTPRATLIFPRPELRPVERLAKDETHAEEAR